MKIHDGLFHFCWLSFFGCLIKNPAGINPAGFCDEVPSRFELENKGFADLRLTTWLWHRKKMER